MTSRMSIGAASSVAVLAAVAFVPSALAQTPAFNMGWSAGGGPVENYDWATHGTLNGYGDWIVDGSKAVWTGWSYTGQLVGSFPGQGDGTWDLSWNCVFSVTEGVAAGGSAFITANIVVTNNDVVNQNFSLLMTLSTGFLGDLSERGSIVGTITDLTFDDATVFAPVSGRIYTPMIDGSPEAPGFLMNDPFQESAGGPLFSGTVGPADFGLPVPVAASQTIDSTIGILLDFDLTPGDSASFTAIFEVLPAPAGLPILAALGLVAGRTRRRKA